jgi:hypothetical protein
MLTWSAAASTPIKNKCRNLCYQALIILTGGHGVVGNSNVNLVGSSSNFHQKYMQKSLVPSIDHPHWWTGGLSVTVMLTWSAAASTPIKNKCRNLCYQALIILTGGHGVVGNSNVNLVGSSSNFHQK